MSALLNFAGWSFVPNVASGLVHNGLARLTALAPPGTARHARDRRVIYVLVVLSYLGYTLYTAVRAIEPNFYDLLGVPTDVGEKQLRTAFRRLSATHHPDKGGDEGVFRALRTAYDVLSHPGSRFGHDRFGREVVGWSMTAGASARDYLYRGALAQLPFYLGSLFFIVVLGYLQGATHAMYWRVLTLVTLASVNWSIVSGGSVLASSSSSPFRPNDNMAWLTPRGLVAYQWTGLLQSVCITVLIAISQVGPVIFPPERDATSADAMLETAALAKMCSAEASQALQMVHLPFAQGTSKTAELYERTADWMVRARLDQDPEVLAAKRALHLN